MTESTHTADLAVLRCPGCNAPVPLGDGDTTRCRYCDTTFDVPDRYRELRDAERRRSAEDTDARRLYRSLGRPPGAIARAWGEVSAGCVWLVLWPLALVFDGLLLVKGLEIVSRSIHATLYEVLPNTLIWGGIGVAMYATLAVPLAIGVYGKRRTNARRRLQAALSALPPDRKGGPARCRSCGAPLDVGPSDLGLACVYCGADNLVRMPERWIASLREATNRLDLDADSAASEDRAMRARERSTLRRHLAWPLLFVPAMVAFGLAFDRDADAYPPRWRAAIAGERQLIPATKDEIENYDKPIPPPIAVDGHLASLAFDVREKGDEAYVRSYYIPLRYGETVTLTGGDFPAGARALGFVFRNQMSAVFGDAWHSIGPVVLLYPNRTATFEAPRSAWYRVDVIMVDDVPAGRPFALGVSVSPRP